MRVIYFNLVSASDSCQVHKLLFASVLVGGNGEVRATVKLMESLSLTTKVKLMKRLRMALRTRLLVVLVLS